MFIYVTVAQCTLNSRSYVPQEGIQTWGQVKTQLWAALCLSFSSGSIHSTQMNEINE